MATTEESSVCVQKKITELLVVELKSELEKRNLDKTGNKATLVERLSKSLKDNGINPAEYLFSITSDAQKKGPVKNEKKTGLEAADIVEDALQLDIDDELNEYRDDEVLDLTDPRKDNFKASEDQQREDKTLDGNEENDENGSLFSSPLKSESSGAAIAQLTVNDTITMDTSNDRKNTTDDLSLVVHVDDTQSEIDADLDMSTVSSNANNESKKYSSSKKDDENNKFQNDGKSSPQLDQNTNESKEQQANDEKNTAEKSSASTKDSSVKSTTKENEKSSSKAKSSKSSTSKTSKSSNSDKKSGSVSNVSRNLWVSGLSPKTRASDLQQLFRKYGKVVSAKIITNARMANSRCFGFITMETVEQAEQCILNLNKHELHGRPISVEKESGSLRSKITSSKKEKPKDKDGDKSKDDKAGSPSKDDGDKDDDDKNDDKNKSDSEDKKDDSESKKSKDRKSRDRSRSGERRSMSPFRKMLSRRPIGLRRPMIRRPIGSFLAMRRTFRTMPHSAGINANPVLLRRIETERAIRRRERERELRETEKRRVELLRHQREVERKNQEEKERLEREREKLRIERERLEREKSEYLRLEREKARLERERIEREREELRRRTQVQIPHRLDDTSRGRTSSGPKRVYEQREFEPYWDERKRTANRLDTQQTTGRAPFGDSGATSRFSDFDARNSHGNTFEGRGDYKRSKLDIPSTAASRGEYDIRRESQRHGGHDRDDRRAGGQGSFYNRDSSRGGVPGSRDRDRRTGGRDDWKIHDNRRERFMDKTVSSGVASYGSNPRSFVGGDRSDWSSTDRGSAATNLGKLAYANNSSIGDSRSRQPGLNASIIGGGSTTLGNLFANNGGMPMSGIMSHTSGIGANTNLNSGERYMHSLRRF